MDEMELSEAEQDMGDMISEAASIHQGCGCDHGEHHEMEEEEEEEW